MPYAAVGATPGINGEKPKGGATGGEFKIIPDSPEEDDDPVVRAKLFTQHVNRAMSMLIEKLGPPESKDDIEDLIGTATMMVEARYSIKGWPLPSEEHTQNRFVFDPKWNLLRPANFDEYGGFAGWADDLDEPKPPRQKSEFNDGEYKIVESANGAPKDDDDLESAVRELLANYNAGKLRRGSHAAWRDPGADYGCREEDLDGEDYGCREEDLDGPDMEGE